MLMTHLLNFVQILEVNHASIYWDVIQLFKFLLQVNSYAEFLTCNILKYI
jgi:hypothetical protein